MSHTRQPAERIWQNGAQKQDNKLNTAEFSAKLLEARRFVSHCWHERAFASEKTFAPRRGNTFPTDANTLPLCERVC